MLMVFLQDKCLNLVLLVIILETFTTFYRGHPSIGYSGATLAWLHKWRPICIILSTTLIVLKSLRNNPLAQTSYINLHHTLSSRPLMRVQLHVHIFPSSPSTRQSLQYLWLQAS